MKKLTIKDLIFLRRLYSNIAPKYVPTVGLLDHFIDRFENHPEWREKVQFLTINDNSLNDGTFMRIYATIDGSCISINSLESTPNRNLEHLLNSLSYSEKKIYIFWAIGKEFQNLIENLAKVHNLEVLENSRAECLVFKLNQDIVLNMLQNAPDGFYYDSLKKSDVPKIKSALSYIVLPGYLETVIKYNPTTALYTNDGELIAWTIMHENGESGMLEVLEKYKRSGFGSELVLRQSLKLQAMKRLHFGFIYHGNNAAHNFFHGMNHKISNMISVGKFSFVTVKPSINLNFGKYKL